MAFRTTSGWGDRLGGDSALRLGYIDVCEQQIPKFGVFKVLGNALRFRHLTSS
jgi:hypothetical protein